MWLLFLKNIIKLFDWVLLLCFLNRNEFVMQFVSFIMNEEEEEGGGTRYVRIKKIFDRRPTILYYLPTWLAPGTLKVRSGGGQDQDHHLSSGKREGVGIVFHNTTRIPHHTKSFEKRKQQQLLIIHTTTLAHNLKVRYHISKP